MFNDSQLAILKRAVRLFVEHEQRVVGEISEELQELHNHFHSEPVAETVVETVVEAPVDEKPAEDATPASTEK
jgi:hypothetical protein